MKKNILIVANHALEDSSSNGRTMMKLLGNIKAENLAQFYIHGNPNKDVCQTYYQVTDSFALDAFLFRKRKNKKEYSNDISSAPIKKKEFKVRKNCKSLYLRNIIWNSFRWWKRDFTRFLNEFKPNVVILQAGDAPFMYAIARKIAKKYNCALIMYNSEAYVLKEKLYNGVKKNSLWHKLLKHSLKKQYKKFMKHADYCIYSLKELEDAYQEKYPHEGKSCTLYTSSDLVVLPDKSGQEFHIVYCGNLGVGRDVALDSFAQVLFLVNSNAVLDIYGRFLSEEQQERVCKNKNVQYHGVVAYEKIPEIMSRANMLLHCENSDRLINLRYAFSTKIADSLASGRPFLVYASKNYPFVQYLLTNKCAHIATTENELKLVLKNCMDSKEYVAQYVKNALRIAAKNHSVEVNSNKVKEIIVGLNP